jgi:hypothetical protein
MSTVEEQAQDAPKGETKRELVHRQLTARVHLVEELERKVADLTEREHEAREVALRASPSASAYSLGARPQKARADREAADKKLATVRLEVSTLDALARELDAEHAEAVHAERKRDLDRARRAERQAIEAMADHLGLLIRVYSDEYVPALEAIDVLAHPSTVGQVPVQHRGAWTAAARPTVSPCLADAENALERLLDSMADPRGLGYRMVKNRETARSDYDRVLPSLCEPVTLRDPQLACLEGSRSRQGRRP